MISFVIGLAIMWLVITIRGKSFTVKGLPSIFFMAIVCYGLGSLVVLLIVAR